MEDVSRSARAEAVELPCAPVCPATLLAADTTVSVSGRAAWDLDTSSAAMIKQLRSADAHRPGLSVFQN